MRAVVIFVPLVLGCCALAHAQGVPDAARAGPVPARVESPFKCVETSEEAELVVTVAYYGG
ncbi:MAG: hypothetical protein HY901_09905 [Deltaproteobacteria bacterium]|nr:hypothetical protein [Deltaproteobacteria bacterium]